MARPITARVKRSDIAHSSTPFNVTNARNARPSVYLLAPPPIRAFLAASGMFGLA